MFQDLKDLPKQGIDANRKDFENKIPSNLNIPDLQQKASKAINLVDTGKQILN